MANDRGVLTVLRRLTDRIFGDGMTHTLTLRLPELLHLRAEHFVGDPAIEVAQSLFARSVGLVEIETHSYCNRTCWFCPNSQVDRRSTRRYLPEATFAQILADLASIGYAGRMSFSRYNEPFGDDIIFKRFEQARGELPRARLLVYSNGDFLTAEKLKLSAHLGINKLEIGLYLPNGSDWSSELAERCIHRAATRLKVPLLRRREAVGEHISYESHVESMVIRLFSPNYARYGTDRGGTVVGVPYKVAGRLSPCLYAVTDVYIDYNGQVMPCCHLRSDLPSHSDCSIGHINDTPGSIFRAWSSARAARWRLALCRFGSKQGPCSHCSAREWSHTRAARRLFRLGLGRAGADTHSRHPGTVPLPILQGNGCARP